MTGLQLDDCTRELITLARMLNSHWGSRKYRSLTPTRCDLKCTMVPASWRKLQARVNSSSSCSKSSGLCSHLGSEHMSVVGQPGLSLTDIVPGLLCCASSIIDKRWYRAVVISAHDGSGGVSL